MKVDSVLNRNNEKNIFDIEKFLKMFSCEESACEILGLFKKTLPKECQAIKQAYSNYVHCLAQFDFLLNRLNSTATFMHTPRLRQVTEHLHQNLKVMERKVNRLYEQLLKEIEVFD